MALCYILGLYELEEEEKEVVWADEEVSTVEVEFVRRFMEEKECSGSVGGRAWRETLDCTGMVIERDGGECWW
jgi:hypothetical protein